MRSYPRDSPEAGARILALVLISEGHVGRTEFEALNQLKGLQYLGLDPQEMPNIWAPLRAGSGHRDIQPACTQDELTTAGITNQSCLLPYSLQCY